MSFLSRFSKICAAFLVVYVLVWLLSMTGAKVVEELFFTPFGAFIIFSLIIGEAYLNNLERQPQEELEQVPNTSRQ